MKDALKQINDPGNQKFGNLDLSFEEAYCHYRLNEALKALQVLDKCIGSSKKEGPKHRELRAQILYRLERFSECFDIYRDVIKNSMVDDEFEEERMTNLAAVSANLEYEGEAKNAFPETFCPTKYLPVKYDEHFKRKVRSIHLGFVQHCLA